MNAPRNTEEELLLRVFAAIKESHFTDHKLLPVYCTAVRFPRSLGEQIADLIQSRFPEHYDAERRRHLAVKPPAPRP